MKGAVAQLREIVPQRPLTYLEGLQVAEVQATKLILLGGMKRAGAVPSRVISENYRRPRCGASRRFPCQD